MISFHAWLVAFGLTLSSELAVAIPALGAENSRARRVAVVTLAQVATHPAVWFIWPQFGLSRSIYLLLAEAFAVIVEAALYRAALARVPWSRAFGASALANGASVALGLLLLS